MPDALPGATFAPSYDVDSIPGETIDGVTGLIWQQTLPNAYPRCTGAVCTQYDTCTWSEAGLQTRRVVVHGADPLRLRAPHEGASRPRAAL
jgi:hypothetical protein